MFHIVLVQPEIPPNTGNIIRLAANTGCMLHLIEPLGFSMDDKHMRRAGLDYHEYAEVRRHANWAAFLENESPDPARLFALTTRGTRTVHEVDFHNGDWLVFGAETRGLAPELRETLAPAQQLRVPGQPRGRVAQSRAPQQRTGDGEDLLHRKHTFSFPFGS